MLFNANFACFKTNNICLLDMYPIVYGNCMSTFLLQMVIISISVKE